MTSENAQTDLPEDNTAADNAANNQDAQEEDPSKVAAEGTKADGAPAEGEPAEEGAEGGQKSKKKKSEPRILVPFLSEEVEEIIKQALTLTTKEIEREEYDNGKTEIWKTMIEDYIIQRLNTSSQPYKFVTYICISQNSGDALDISFGGFYQADFDGYVTSHWENADVLIDVIVMAFSVQ